MATALVETFETQEAAQAFVDAVDDAIDRVRTGGRQPVTLVLERHVRRMLNNALRMVGESVQVPMTPAQIAPFVDVYDDIPIVVGESGVGSCVVGLGEGSDHRIEWMDVRREWGE